MRNGNIFAIAEELLNLDELIEEHGLESSEVNLGLQDTVKQLSEDLDKEAEKVLDYIHDKEAVAQALRQRANELSERARGLEARAAKVEQCFIDVMNTLNRKKVYSGCRTATVCDAGGNLSIDVYDKKAVLDDERFVLVKLEVDLVGLRDHLTSISNGKEVAGVSIPGAIFQARKQYLRSK